MTVNTIDGGMFKEMVLKAADSLNKNRESIDALNVFPVPDGDTGTNMSLTVVSAAHEVASLPDSCDVEAAAKAVAFGALKGARGNSGVIMSQLLRGIAKGLEGISEADTKHMAHALTKAAETAYKAVMKPKEGTILTIAREIGEKALEISKETEDFNVFFDTIIEHGNEVLQKTKEMLPVLKQADVIDAGGQGLMICIQSAAAYLKNGDKAELSYTIEKPENIQFSALEGADSDITFEYCTEFFVNNQNKSLSAHENEFKEYLDKNGDSVVVVADENLMKIHVHTNNPGAILEKALKYGSLSNVKVENMRIQHSEKIAFIKETVDQNKYITSYEAMRNAERRQFGFVAVSSGEGFREIFKSFNVDEVIEGGQTMNPSSEDIAAAISRINAENVFVFPNNKNIILSAELSADLCEGVKVYIVPTKSMPQGINALFNFIYEESAEENMARMTETYSQIKTGQITTSVRNTTLDGHNIKEGDAICLLDGKIVHSCESVEQAAKHLADMMAENGEFFSIYYGAEVGEEKAKQLADYLTEKYGEIELEMMSGGQSVYQYILSVI